MDRDFGFYLHMAVDLLLVAFVALAWASPRIKRAFTGGHGRWRDLAAAHPASGPPPQDALPRQTLAVGPVLYRNCMTVAADASGLFLAPGAPVSLVLKQSVRIPWAAIVKTEPARLQWGAATTLMIGGPAPATITVNADLFEKRLRPWLAPARQ